MGRKIAREGQRYGPMSADEPREPPELSWSSFEQQPAGSRDAQERKIRPKAVGVRLV